MSVVFGLLRIMESADNFDAGIRLIGRLFLKLMISDQLLCRDGHFSCTIQEEIANLPRE